MSYRHWTGAAGDGKPTTAGNWLEGAVPVDADVVIFADNDVDLDADLGGLSGVRLAALHVRKSYTGMIGSETAYWEIGADEVFVGQHDGLDAATGSTRIKLDLEAITGGGTVVTVYDSASSSEDEPLRPIQLLLDDAAAVVRVRGGGVGLAAADGETSVVDAVEIAEDLDAAVPPDVVVGVGVTLATLVQDAGACLLQAPATTVTVNGGALTTEGSGAIGTLNAGDGAVCPNSTGTISALNLRNAEVDCRRSRAARTITAVAVREGAAGSIAYDPAVVTIGTLTPDGPVKLVASL